MSAEPEPFQLEASGELDADAVLSLHLKAPGVQLDLQIDDDSYPMADQVLAAVPTAVKIVLERLEEQAGE